MTYFIKRWSEAESFTIYENHAYRSKKNLMFAQNFEATFLHTFCRQLRSLHLLYLKIMNTGVRFAQNFEATLLHTFCRQLRSLHLLYLKIMHTGVRQLYCIPFVGNLEVFIYYI